MLGETFDPNSEYSIFEHTRPHWSQTGTIVFITFRTADSIPRSVVLKWEREKNEWLKHKGVSVAGHWSNVVAKLEPKLRTEFERYFSRHRDEFLDTCHGECVLQRPDLALIVSESLMFFDGVRYRMGDFVVMPNHVHLLCSFYSERALVEQCDSWLHYTARQINRRLGRKGKFWQQEPFDHLVRSPEQYDYFRRYIAENVDARLG